MHGPFYVLEFPIAPVSSVMGLDGGWCVKPDQTIIYIGEDNMGYLGRYMGGINDVMCT